MFKKYILPVLFLGLWLFGAGIQPIPLTDAANSTFSDEVSGDKKGGWTDEGHNDLRIISRGKVSVGGIPFEILGDGGKNCLVLGKSKLSFVENEATVTLAQPVKGKVLYLLHACAMNTRKGEKAGLLTAEYEDGSKYEWRVRIGRDVQPWTQGRGCSNAYRSWSMYNGTSQVSLFVSKFELTKPVRALTFKAEDALWMLAGVSIGDDALPTSILPEYVITKDYEFPAPLDKSVLEAQPAEGAKPKNIIYIIGDGMGGGCQKLASLYAHGSEGKLVMESLPAAGMCTTYSGSSQVTDSAASGTALSSGYKTYNGAIGMDLSKKPHNSIAELAFRHGKAIGLMTTDSLTGATPSAFAAHVPSRGMASEIAEWYGKCGFNVLIGGNSGPFVPKTAGGIRADERNIKDEMKKNGYAEISSLEELNKAPVDTKVFGFTGWDNEKVLAQYTEVILPKLAAQGKDNGFFVMIECSWPDGGGHGNNPNRSLQGVLCTDFVVKTAVEFAAKNKDTLVVVTADHETGYLFAVPNKKNSKRPLVMYQTVGHSMAPVPIFAYGPGAEMFNGVMDNTDVPKKMAAFWDIELGGWSEK